MEYTKTVQTGDSGDSSSGDVEQRIRKTRKVAAVIVAVSAVSLVAAVIVYPVPVTFLLVAGIFGGLIAAGLSLRRKVDVGIPEGLLFGVFYGAWIFLRDQMFPGMGDNVFTTFWSGMSAWALGYGLFVLPLARFSHERKRHSLQTDVASLQRYRASGDSPFVAQLRMSAGKTGKGRMITLIAMGGVMAGFGLYTWLFMDLLVGLVLAAMMTLPVAFFVWMLKLRGSSHHQNTL
ncbi:MAG: hypothetical protein KFH87_02715 [Bacteroidetes bacterium]|nr:hypothetical protein [Bacteroidota bacterium]